MPSAGPEHGGFHLRGKMGLVYGEESFSARFLWLQQGRQFTIDLWGPMGQGRVQLVGNDRHLELREGDGSLISEGPPEAVMLHHLGWSLPLGVLPQWVRGRPASGIRVTGRSLDDAGRLTAFRQLDWQVALERYRPVALASGEQGTGGAGPVQLPHRVTAQRDDYRVRLAISEWRLGAPLGAASRAGVNIAAAAPAGESGASRSCRSELQFAIWRSLLRRGSIPCRPV